ncbi:MAG: malonic semialdehyde reductase [Hyphomonadaceae bacterium]|nr:malonic semialdehyde reductase [Hyphomonadaceae bacterium]
MAYPVSDEAFDTIFRKARSYNTWQEKDVPETLIRATYDLHKWGPTSANCSPARYVFLHSEAAKARLIPHLIGPNQEKSRTSPWVVIIATDMAFQEKMPALFPHNPGAKDWFQDPEVHATTAFRNGTLQSAYFLIAARALGLDTGPMSGFNNAGVDEEFFIGQGGEKENWRSNWICNLGYGSKEGLFDRSPRLGFEEACEIL